MSKKTADYTLGEVKELCNNIYCPSEGCPGCPVKEWCDKEEFLPGAWDLSDPPRWTAEEVERAKAIKVLWPDMPYLTGTDEERSAVTEHPFPFPIGGKIYFLPKGLFPNIQPGESVKLEEIINEKA